MIITFGFEPRDIWIGVYWRRGFGGWHWDVFDRELKVSSVPWDVYICILPCLPLRLHWERVTYERCSRFA
jgi:hypothetical protein